MKIFTLLLSILIVSPIQSMGKNYSIQLKTEDNEIISVPYETAQHIPYIAKSHIMAFYTAGKNIAESTQKNIRLIKPQLHESVLKYSYQIPVQSHQLHTITTIIQHIQNDNPSFLLEDNPQDNLNYLAEIAYFTRQFLKTHDKTEQEECAALLITAMKLQSDWMIDLFAYLYWSYHQ